MSSEPSLVESFMEVTCCDKDTAASCITAAGGNMAVAVDRYFRGHAAKWDPPQTQAHTKDEPQQPPTQSKESLKRSREEDDTGDEEREQLIKETSRTPRTKANMSASNTDDDHLDPSLPWNQQAVKGLPQPEVFEFDSVKSKLQTTNFQGPQEGSTWHWFLVAEQKVFPDDNDKNNATAHLRGDKFQAGWGKTPDEKVGEKVFRDRQATMIQSVLEKKLNSYGKARRGVQPGYSHQWRYADSTWTSEKNHKHDLSTQDCFWTEQKLEDRWVVNVSMNLKSNPQVSKGVESGCYLVIADQIASKLNKNQYQTRMKGRRWKIGEVTDSDSSLENAKKEVLEKFLPALKAHSVEIAGKNKASKSPVKKAKKL